MSRPAFASSLSLYLRRPFTYNLTSIPVAVRCSRFLGSAVAGFSSAGRARAGAGGLVGSISVDLRAVRRDVEAYKRNIRERGVDADVQLVVDLYNELCKLETEAGDVRRRRNENAGLLKGKRMDPSSRQSVIEEGKSLKKQLERLEERLGGIQDQLRIEALRIPNRTHPDVPVGGEEMARIVQVVGEKRKFGFDVKDHLEIALGLDLVDLEAGAKVSGSKFYFMKNAGAMLEVALINWAMMRARKAGFTLLTTPDVARESVVSACGFSPRGESSQIYRVQDSDLCLVGTSEIPLGGYYSSQILEKEELPIRMAAFGHCFRREVGAAGGSTRGLYRVHQFSKVEMFVISTPEQSDALHDELIQIEKDMFESLGFHFHVLDMPTEDLGNPAYRKIDIEAWMPGRGSYGEISSASNCTDYQARRLNIRYREKRGDNRFVHTLNATACAIPRMVVTILENNQQPDGSVIIPEPLRPYMGGQDVIRAPVVGAPVAAV